MCVCRREIERSNGLKAVLARVSIIQLYWRYDGKPKEVAHAVNKDYICTIYSQLNGKKGK